MQLSGTLVAVPSAAPSDGHPAFAFGATALPAAVDDDVVRVVVPGACGAAAPLILPGDAPDPDPIAAFAVPAGVVPIAFPGARPGTLGSIVV